MFKINLTEFRHQMRSGELLLYLSLNRLTYGRTDRPSYRDAHKKDFCWWSILFSLSRRAASRFLHLRARTVRLARFPRTKVELDSNLRLDGFHRDGSHLRPHTRQQRNRVSSEWSNQSSGRHERQMSRKEVDGVKFMKAEMTNYNQLIYGDWNISRPGNFIFIIQNWLFPFLTWNPALNFRTHNHQELRDKEWGEAFLV